MKKYLMITIATLLLVVIILGMKVSSLNSLLNLHKRIFLEGILFDDNNPNTSIAAINGRTFKRGDIIAGYLLKDIKELSIILEKGNKTFEIQFNTEKR